MTESKIELAKSWFILAEILIILAGFFFATAGVAWSNSLSTLNLAVSSLDDTFYNSIFLVEKNISQNVSQEYLNITMERNSYLAEMTLSGLGVLKFTMYFACGLVLASILCWIIGRHRLTKC